MNILTTLAQASSYSYEYSSGTTRELTPGEVEAFFTAMAAFTVFFIFVAIGVYVVGALLLMPILKKAGVPAWVAWVPFYNTWKFLEIGGQHGFWAVLAILPVVNIVSTVFMYISMYNIGLKTGKSGSFVLLGIFLPIVWYIWVAVDKTPWDDAAGAPSLAPETATIPAAA